MTSPFGRDDRGGGAGIDDVVENLDSVLSFESVQHPSPSISSRASPRTTPLSAPVPPTTARRLQRGRYSSGGNLASTRPARLSAPLPASAARSLGGGNVAGKQSKRGLVRKEVPVTTVRVGDDLCLAVIGSDRLCLAKCRQSVTGEKLTHCHKSTHGKSQKFELLGEVAYHVPSADVAGSKACFRKGIVSTHLLDSTAEEFALDKFRSSTGWDETIDWAANEWALHVAAQQPVKKPPPSSSKKGIEHEGGGDGSSAEGDGERDGNDDQWDFLSGVKAPTVFVPPDEVEVPEVQFFSSVAEDVENADVLEELRDAVKNGVERLELVAGAVPEMGEAVVDFLLPPLESIITTLKEASDALRDIDERIGDTHILSAFGHQDMSQALVKILQQEDFGAVAEDLKLKIEQLDDAGTKLDEDINLRINQATMVIAKKTANHIKAILERLLRLENSAATNPLDSIHLVSSLAGGLSPSAPSTHSTPTPTTVVPPTTIQAVTMILDDAGVPIMSLKDLMHDHVMLKSKVSELESAVIAQGGVSIGSHAFPSEEALLALVMKENPSAKGVAAFICPMSVWAHDAASPMSGNGHELLARQGLSSKVERNYVMSYSRQYPAAYVGTDSSVTRGTKVAAFKSSVIWNGENGLDGEKGRIGKTITSALASADSYATTHLPEGSKLLKVAEATVKVTRNFFDTLHAHVLDESTKLVQLKVPENEALILVSEQFVLIYDKFWTIRRLMMELEEGKVSARFFCRSVWLTLKVLMVVDELIAESMKYHPILANSFIRFLTKQTGSNVSSGVGGSLSTLKGELATLKADLETAVADSKAAKKSAEAANNEMDDLLRKNESLKPPNKGKRGRH